MNEMNTDITDENTELAAPEQDMVVSSEQTEEVAVEGHAEATDTPVTESKEPLVLSEEDEQDALRLLEALLFTASDMVTLNELQPFFPPRTPLADLIEKLQVLYHGRGVEVVQRGTGWGIRTAADLGERMQIRKSETKPMSRPVIETLAIIAYHQPVTKAEIEQIRGVSVGKNILETLLEQNLIKPGKRREVPGRPLTWMTSPHFLDMFGLTGLKDLPNLQEMRDQGLLTVTPPNFNLQATLNLEGEEDGDEADHEDLDDHDDDVEQQDLEESLSSDDDSDYNEDEEQDTEQDEEQVQTA
jgi:segregation and condensation protein B